ncbi:MAG: hypothetical protein RL095_2247 [Verrucomicrobiota bacterium]|jgi:hypothetical protein
MQSDSPSRLTPLRLLLAALVFVASMSWTSCTHEDGYQHLSWLGTSEVHADKDSCCCCEPSHESQSHSHETEDACPPGCEDELIAAEEYAPGHHSINLGHVHFLPAAAAFILPEAFICLDEKRCHLGCADPPPAHLEFLLSLQQLI